jgi:hypothetical protein
MATRHNPLQPGGITGWVVVHHSLDGREQVEPNVNAQGM